MSCCGQGRRAYLEKIGAIPPSGARSGGVHRVVFEYLGRTGMTVVGPATGVRYRFDRPGARVVVDPRDHAAVAAVPHLREVR